MRIFNYIKVAFRSLFRFRTDAIINVIGLSVGITISIIVLLYVRNELNYDKHFSDYEHIYRVVTKGSVGQNSFKSAYTPEPLGTYLKNNFSEVKDVVRFVRGANKLVSYQDKQFNEDNFFYADSVFFNLFDVDFIKGDPEKVLNSEDNVVITEAIADKYFENENPIGKNIELDNGLNFTVTGICKAFPGNSHFHFDFVASQKAIRKLYKVKEKKDSIWKKKEWLQLSRYTYVNIEKGVDIDMLTLSIQDKLKETIQNQINELVSDGQRETIGIQNLTFELQPLTDIHLYSSLDNELEVNSKRIYVVLFLSVAVFVLLITCLNFMNLTTARLSVRLEEIAIRKLTGVSRLGLFTQFIIEAMTYSFIALFIGLVLVELLLPGFNMLFDLHLKLNRLESRVDLFYVTVLTLFVGLFSGLYPAIYFSGYREVVIFKKNFHIGKNSLIMRGVLASSQMLVATFVVILTIGMYWQVQFLKNKDLGFESKNVLVVERGHSLGNDFVQFKEDIKGKSGVIEVSACSSLPGEKASLRSYTYTSKGGDKMVLLPYNYVEKDFFKVLGINFYSGSLWEDTDRKMSSDVVINTKAMDVMNLSKPLGLKLKDAHAGGYEIGYSIVGVTKNFHFEPIQFPIRPLVLMDLPKGGYYDNLIIKVSEKGLENGVINDIHQTWNSYTNFQPFEYKMLSEVLSNNLTEEKTVLRLLLVFAILSVFVALLGIRSFSTFVGDYKYNDLKVKKLLGASPHHIFADLFKEIGQYLLVGVVLSIPLVYSILLLWLKGFAYYSRVPVLIMLAVGGIMFGLEFLFILIHSSKLINSSPVYNE